MFSEEVSNIIKVLRCVNDMYDYVIDDVIDNLEEETDKELIRRVSEICEYGCISGTVGSMVYYPDTIAFFNHYKSEINEELSSLMWITRLSIDKLFNNFDTNDILCNEKHNKNILAWFGYETVCHRLASRLSE